MDTWFIFPIIAAFLFSTVNYLDKFLIEKISGDRGIGALVLFSALAGVPVVIILSIFLRAEILNIDARNAIFMILAGMSYLGGVIFYLYSLWEEEVSSIIPQMLIIPVITLVMGYIFLGEEIRLIQGAGGLMILAGAMILTYNFNLAKHAKLKILGYIFTASFFIAINQIIFKYGVIEEGSFWATIYWEHIGFCLMALIIFIFIPSYKKDFFSILKNHGMYAIGINSIGEIITIIGNMLLHYAGIFVPVGLVMLTVEGVQPFFLIGMGLFITIFFPHLLSENITRKNLSIKLAACIIMMIGMILLS